MNGHPVAYSRSVITELMVPSYANFGGKVHGGTLMSLMDKLAYVCASKHEQSALRGYPSGRLSESIRSGVLTGARTVRQARSGARYWSALTAPHPHCVSALIFL